MAKSLVVVAMSGGVDSSVAAGLLLEQGYDVVGVTMRLWTLEDAEAPRHHRSCCAGEDFEAAAAVAAVLGIRHYVLNFERQFAEGVVDRFLRGYASGRTPNPCLDCNDRVKFRLLLEHALALGAEWLATGHYARIVSGAAGHELWRAVDASKDQSYALYTLGQRELQRILFPLGERPKEEVRALAHRWGFANADKPDSTDICFIPSGDYRAFLRQRLSDRPGEIMDRAGNVLGRHQGILGYTVGQRKKLPARGGDKPLFVLGLDAQADTVVVGPQEALLADGLRARELSFTADGQPDGPLQVEARIRYRGRPAPAVLTLFNGGAELRFQEPQRAVSPGQAVVFYEGERVLGGGTIVERL